jgi:site-specific DNA-methyltransferase (adenine-specific)
VCEQELPPAKGNGRPRRYCSQACRQRRYERGLRRVRRKYNVFEVLHGDARDIIKTLPDHSVHACITDPPYHLTSPKGGFGHGTKTDVYARINRGFRGKWDGGKAAFEPDIWRECLRVLKPGAHLLAFGAPRTHHRLWCAIEDVGFEIRDTVAWLHAMGLPKSGTGLKPAMELICLARKPLAQRSVERNVLMWGTGALNVKATQTSTGGWPANVVHDGLEEPWARYFYCPKANKHDRDGSKHPTIKPIKLMEWLCKLICPPGGTILDPFAGSGTTGRAALNTGYGCILVEAECEYVADIERRFAGSPYLE